MDDFTSASGSPPVATSKIRVRPQGRKFSFPHMKCLAQKTRRTPFHELHQAMNAKWGIDTHEKMHMIRHHFEFFDLCLLLFTDLTNDLFDPLIKRWHQYLSPIFRAPDHRTMAGREHISVAFVGRLIHRSSI